MISSGCIQLDLVVYQANFAGWQAPWAGEALEAEGEKTFCTPPACSIPVLLTLRVLTQSAVPALHG
jgi:hypothetical protein